MKFLATLAFFLVIGAVLAAGISIAATKGSVALLLIGSAVFVGLFVKFGCLTH